MTKEQKLNKQIEEQQEVIENLNSKVGNLSDKLGSLQGQINGFKSAVGQDIATLTERIDMLKDAIIKLR